MSATLTLGRRCPECDEGIDALAPDAKFCSKACKQRAWRKGQAKNKPDNTERHFRLDRALLRRHRAALRLIEHGVLDDVDPLDLLAAVCWPRDKRLLATPERRAA